MIYRNSLRPSTRFGLVLLVFATAGTLLWLGLLLDEDMGAFDLPGLVVLGLDVILLTLSVLLFCRARWARTVTSIVLHLIAVGSIALGVVSMWEAEGIGFRPAAVGFMALAAGLSFVGILALYNSEMCCDLARALDPQGVAARRRRLRRIALTLAGLVVLGISWAAWRIVPLLLAKPTISVDYLAQANELSRPPDYDPNLNAAPYYEKLFAEFVPLPEGLAGQVRLWPTGLRREQLEMLEQWASSNEAALRALVQAAQCPYWYYDLTSDNGALCDVTIPYLSEVRACAWSFVLLAKYRASQGAIEDAIELLMNVHMIGVHRVRGGTLLEQIAGGGICKICQDALLSVLARCEVNVDTFRRTLTTLTAREPCTAIPRFAETERLYGYDAIQRAFSDDGRGSGRLIPGPLYETKKEGGLYSPPLSYLDAVWICLRHPDRAETVQVYDRYWRAVNLLADKSPWDLFRAGSSYEAKLDEMLADAYYLHDGYQATAGCINIGWHNRAESRGTTAILAILTRRAEVGQWARSLRELVDEGYLRDVPMDPYSDQPLVYQVEGERFVLYSAGEDFLDDGGMGVTWDQSQSGGDRVFWPVERVDDETAGEAS
ncbi:MAG: hypothetical protein JW993_14725 [Sedimentisphaerales bacterium]|nr:hypothetical protein [Sedimentisphaerales bacterium]